MNLTAEEREFFTLVNQAVFTNPFSDARRELDQKIAGAKPEDSKMELIEKAIYEVDKRIQALEDRDGADIALYADDDRILVEKAFIFEFFYHFREQFDTLIKNQLQSQDTLKATFIRDAIQFFLNRGFDTDAACRYIAICYQVRRAFYFIQRNLIGKSPVMKKLRLKLWNHVFTHDLNFYDQSMWNRMEDFSILILGETGTGKGTAAMAVGRSGFIPLNKRRTGFVENFNQAFTSLNLSQFPEGLIESELFGHKKGAFTGAVEDHKGILAQCSPYGAILLDEIGDLSTSIQIKLLQVLQDRVFCPVGSHKACRFHGRVIAATNRPLHELRSAGGFRDDFYYRLCSGIIVAPSLKDRIREYPRELDDLLAFTIKRMIGEPSPELVAAVRHVIDKNLGDSYLWPGNVRELEQCVRRVLMEQTYAGDGRPVVRDLQDILTEGVSRGTIPAQHLLAGYCYLLYSRCGTFEETARRAGLDSRTVKKYIREWESVGKNSS